MIGDGDVAGQTEGDDVRGVGRIPLVVTVPVQIPLAAAEHTNLNAAVAVPIAGDGDVAGQTEGDDVRGVGRIPLVVAVPSTYHVPLRNTPTLRRPSPFQSPITGTSPGKPKE